MLTNVTLPVAALTWFVRPRELRMLMRVTLLVAATLPWFVRAAALLVFVIVTLMLI